MKPSRHSEGQTIRIPKQLEKIEHYEAQNFVAK
jgi:hypothetical protein